MERLCGRFQLSMSTKVNSSFVLQRGVVAATWNLYLPHNTSFHKWGWWNSLIPILPMTKIFDKIYTNFCNLISGLRNNIYLLILPKFLGNCMFLWFIAENRFFPYSLCIFSIFSIFIEVLGHAYITTLWWRHTKLISTYFGINWKKRPVAIHW